MKNKNDLAIKLVGLSKTYQLHYEKPTLVENLFRNGYQKPFTALDNIDLEIYKGEKVGIIGKNGSGKTTLLKIIAGIATASKGKLRTWGKLVSLIDLSAGFHPELTGRENIFLNAMLVGMGREESVAKYDDIVKFADIGTFIDAPMYTYSEGMKLRLGYSVAVAVDPDILILDEGLMAGDQDFQKRSTAKLGEFFRQKKTILVVTHWLDYLRDHCQRILVIDKGKIVADGGKEELIKYQGPG
jgi:ABC-type polysaccharide/polyol phosphate transport system ATPase subunit